MNIQDLQDLLAKAGGGLPQPGSQTLGDEEKRQTEEIVGVQRASLEKWEKDPTSVKLEELCNAYVTTYEDRENVQHDLQFLDEDGKTFLSTTVIAWVDDAMPRLKKLIVAASA